MRTNLGFSFQLDELDAMETLKRIEIEVAHEVIDALARGADRRVGLFFEMVRDLLVPKNFVGPLFLHRQLRTQRDDLGQWRAYAENGKGFALGLAPRMFEVVDGVALPANELSFVGQVLYDRQAIFARHENAIAAAASIFLRAVQAHAELVADKRVGIPFMWPPISITSRKVTLCFRPDWPRLH